MFTHFLWTPSTSWLQDASLTLSGTACLTSWPRWSRGTPLSYSTLTRGSSPRNSSTLSIYGEQPHLPRLISKSGRHLPACPICCPLVEEACPVIIAIWCFAMTAIWCFAMNSIFNCNLFWTPHSCWPVTLDKLPTDTMARHGVMAATYLPARHLS